MKSMGESSPLVNAIGSMKTKEGKPMLEVRASMKSHNYAMDDNKWRKEDLKRCRQELKAMEDEIANWDGDKVAKQALQSLKKEVAMMKSRIMEHEAMLDDEGMGEEGAEDKEKGAVVGGPYEIKKKGDKFVVARMDTGAIKGTFDSREAALKQFRLLEGIEHGWKPSGKK